ncbi:energy transducer TonB [Pedobacter soli]|uniref:MORN repeat variant n=1 Tax=Pedobacter soli TaxID=390242 RepID=A0A1G6YYH9_9SPHI|nr:energy transducer TonB [Pedobacter soli]SDD94616.1 MORN repeat variant [Pedobacter soli]
MKKLILSIFLFILAFLAKAQKMDTVYFDHKWVKTDKSNKYYYRIVEKNKSKETFLVKDFYNTGTLQMEGTYSSIDPEVKNGEFVWYYENGQKRIESTYKNNEVIKEREWDRNGNLKKEQELVNVTNSTTGEATKAVIERAPQFPGGKAALFDFISRKVKYPSTLIKEGITGKVIVRFVVTKEGKVTDPEIVQSVHPLLDAEAIRVVKLMPKWEPGKQNGEFINVKFSLPFNFNL